MIRKYNYLILSMAVVLMSACKTQKEVIVDYPVVIEEELLDTMVVTASPIDPEEEPVIENTLPVYQASATRYHDLIHTKLNISFDWEKQYVLGEAELTLKPYFYSTDELVLDAKVFDIHRITQNGALLEYNYDQQKLKIKLDRVYSRDEEYTVQINYTAKPNEGPSGGSAAITSDKGLFFINPLNESSTKPQQIWTQGETENSSRWFPTIDKPNERCSQEIYISVENRFKTLSNGVLVESKSNGNGTRTDYWKQDKPHAPYLFMVGVGEYAVVEDSWNDMPLMYYVEPEFENDAEKIFNHTPEMLDFFSDRLDYEYPWDKYAQIVCRDYVSGAMENTGAVVFGEFVQKNSRELLDSPNDDIVAHEMFHHWFGDLVTCESWSNLSLNEGFATYSEYLWREYKYGHDNAEKKRLEDLYGYLMTAGQGGTHDLIDFEYENKEHMFDAHSYNKGGLIVHMLRSYIGDEAFFAGLNRYLKQNEYTDVEAHELRLAFEDVVGEDLNWFFNQWFYDKGHPELDISYEMEEDARHVKIQVSQTQDPEMNPSIFKFPVETALYYASGKVEYVKQWMDQRDKEFVIPVTGDEMPVVAVFDGKHDILAVSQQQRSEEDYINLFNLSKEYGDRMTAIKELKGTPNMAKIVDSAISSPSSDIRSLVVNTLDPIEHADLLVELASSDKSSAVRAIALKKTASLELAKSIVTKDESFWVVSQALGIISKEDPESAIAYADTLTQSYYKPLVGKIAEIYANTSDPKYLDFFESHVNEVGIYSFFGFVNQYIKLCRSVEDYPRLVKTADIMKGLAMDNSSNYFKKYSATNFIKNLSSDLRSRQEAGDLSKYIDEMEDMMLEIISKSTDQRLKQSFKAYNQP